MAGLGSAILPLSSFATQPAAKCDFISMVKASPHVRHGALYIPTVLDKPAPIFGGWLCSIEHHIFHKQGIDTGSHQDNADCYMAILGDESYQESVQIWQDGDAYTLVSDKQNLQLSESETLIKVGEQAFAFRLNRTNSLLSQSLKLNESSKHGEIAIVVEGDIFLGTDKCETHQVVAVQSASKTVDISRDSAIITLRKA